MKLRIHKQCILNLSITVILQLIEPETEDENENQEFIDQYDKTGKMMQKQTKSMGSQKSISEMYHSNKSLQEREYQ